LEYPQVKSIDTILATTNYRISCRGLVSQLNLFGTRSLYRVVWKWRPAKGIPI